MPCVVQGTIGYWTYIGGSNRQSYYNTQSENITHFEHIVSYCTVQMLSGREVATHHLPRYLTHAQSIAFLAGIIS